MGTAGAPPILTNKALIYKIREIQKKCKNMSGLEAKQDRLPHWKYWFEKYRKCRKIRKNALTGSRSHLLNLIFSAGCTINTSTQPSHTHPPFFLITAHFLYVERHLFHRTKIDNYFNFYVIFPLARAIFSNADLQRKMDSNQKSQENKPALKLSFIPTVP